MDIGLSVDGDLGASKLVEGVFTTRSEVNELDSGALVSIVKSSIKGKLNMMLEGLEESNLRDPGARESANKQSEQFLSALLDELESW